MNQAKFPKNYKQWSFTASDGTELNLAKYLPKEEGVFINPTRHCRNIVAIHYPTYLEEYDKAMEMRAQQVNNIKI